MSKPYTSDYAKFISSTKEIIHEIQTGKMVVLIDEEDRENEGDLVLAADYVTPEAINFMAMHGRGLICLTLTSEHCQRLQLPMMVQAGENGTQFGTNFTVSIEAREGVTTGISASDRSKTIKVAANPKAQAQDIVQPGHVFPLRARDGGVLVRAGHTEAGCDLTRMAGLTPASVICEIMREDGEMARLPELVDFAQKHDLKIGTIKDLIEYRSTIEKLVVRVDQYMMQTPYGEFEAILYQEQNSSLFHMVMKKGEIRAADVITVRVHAPFSVLDILDVQRTTHSVSVSDALTYIESKGQGVVVLLNCQGVGDRLLEQFNLLKKTSPDAAVKADSELRLYGIGAQILKDLGVVKMKLMGKPIKLPSMSGFDLEVVGFEDVGGKSQS